ncbi:hypothetical protein B5G52_07980 [Pseudoalteromonas sp. A601]|uniref:hypothetical protein n=1 Tax=Pseudoalteromonas sp. A601 TaxID=1967839 RepID=UPI000B3D2227|nr:hypothetical protein [Pseudoalteromonas sp. A601]OUS72649.1 hypothetical protein B5G52_07980 [Pseudoalteromonas sp. A601]
MQQVNRVVLFTSSCLAMPTINLLLQAELLVTVVFVDDEAQHIQHEQQQLRAQCEALNINLTRWNNNDQLVAQLDQWHASIAVSCFTARALDDEIIKFFHGQAYGLCCGIAKSHQWTNSLYWHIRTQQNELPTTLQRLNSNENTALQSVVIHPFDTYQSLSLRVASALASALVNVMAKLNMITWQSLNEKQVLPNTAKPITREAITLSFKTHSANDFVAAAKAGNPLYGGFILITQLGEINVLQASTIEQNEFFEPAGTILTINKSAGLIVQTKQGAVVLDIISSQFGCISGYRFASLANISAGMQL